MWRAAVGNCVCVQTTQCQENPSSLRKVEVRTCCFLWQLVLQSQTIVHYVLMAEEMLVPKIPIKWPKWATQLTLSDLSPMCHGTELKIIHLRLLFSQFIRDLFSEKWQAPNLNWLRKKYQLIGLKCCRLAQGKAESRYLNDVTRRASSCITRPSVFLGRSLEVAVWLSADVSCVCAQEFEDNEKLIFSGSGYVLTSLHLLTCPKKQNSEWYWLWVGKGLFQGSFYK